MDIDEEFSELLGALYEGALEEQPWQSFLASVRELLGAHLVTLVLRPPSEQEDTVMLADGGSLSAIKSYNEGQFVLDPFINLPPRQVIALHEHMSTEALLASDFYQIIMEPQGWYDFLGADIREGDELDVRFRVGRYKGASRFGEKEKALIEALLPHLERSIRLQTRINRTERERAVYAGAVEQLAVATIILDEAGQVLSTNDSAELLLKRAQELQLVDGQLRFADRTTAQEFDQLLAEAMDSRQRNEPVAAQAMSIPGREGRSALGLVARVVMSAAAVDGKSIPSLAIFISDPTQASEPPRQVISRLFGFTPTEASLAMLLANGLTLDEASEQLGVSRNTTRTHLRAVFVKTGVSRQTGLVSLILKSVASLAGGQLS
ncbi:MAG: helix-turn-helix transcriptional regulator [Halioglobus sp.]